MPAHTSSFLIAVLVGFAMRCSSEEAQEWQKGATTRYWDCCKPSCAWPGKFQARTSLQVCDASGAPADNNVMSSCGGGGTPGLGYTCMKQQPFFDASTDTSYLFAAASLLGLSEKDWCCACYELVFDTNHTKTGRTVVQVTNTGGDLGDNQFDLQIPGGGFGIFDGCSRDASTRAQFPMTASADWGARYGGLLAAGAKNSRSCDQLPAPLRPGCIWFFERFQALNNPRMRFARIACPVQLTKVSGCSREDDDKVPAISSDFVSSEVPTASHVEETPNIILP